jgi:signal transduction histidine kinase
MRDHLDRILEGLPCGVLVASSDGQISRANPEALRLLEPSLGQGPAGPASLSSLHDAIRQLFEDARNGGEERELNIQGEDNSERWIAARHAAIMDAAGSASIFILRDVSEGKRLEESKAKMGREQVLAEVSTLLAHEIRNPIGSMELFAGLLADLKLDAEGRKCVEHVRAGLRFVSATVNNVLDFDRLPQLQTVPVDLGQLLNWAVDFVKPLATQAGVMLSLQNRVKGVFIAGDRHRLERVLLNLVLNAVQAMTGEGWIELGGRRLLNSQAVALVVSDTGPGIPAEILPRIFEPGFSTRPGSPGLGLSVCRKIVEQHAGSISAASHPGFGAKITLIFPLSLQPSGGTGE